MTGIDERLSRMSVFERYLTVWVALCIVGVLIEVPLMLWLVPVCLRTQGWFQPDQAPRSANA